MLAEWLLWRGVDTVFVVPGLQIDPIFRELCQTREIRVITATHELTAGYMADGFARASGRPGVCISIAAAGTASLLAAAITAKTDQSPVLFITGNVPTAKQPCGAFQDGWSSGTDDLELLRRAVGYSGVAMSIADLDKQLELAFASMFGLPRQPAHVCLPLDIQNEICPDNLAAVSAQPRAPSATAPNATLPADLARHLAPARRVILLAGSRLSSRRGAEALRAFSETFNIPVATTLAAKGLLPENHPLSLGNFGFAGSQRANNSLLNTPTDLLFVLGADLNERDSLGWDVRLRQQHRLILIIDSTPLPDQHPLQPDWVMQADAASVLLQMLSTATDALRPLESSATQRIPWIQSLMEVPRLFQAAERQVAEANTIAPDQLVFSLRENLPAETIMVVDAGLHRLFAGHYWLSLQANAFFSACGLAPLGWALAAAIGIKLANPRQPVVVLTGDGCLQAHGNELATMARFGLPILIVVCNNQAYASIQRHFDSAERAAKMASLHGINWIQYAKALGCPAFRLENVDDLPSILNSHLASFRQAHGSPLVLEANTTGHTSLPSPTVVPSAGSSADFQRGQRSAENDTCHVIHAEA